MEDTNWGDDANVERWCSEQRQNALRYLNDQPVTFGALAERPAWHVAPYVSVWAIESVKVPRNIGWWVISGDLPTDYTSADAKPDPRSALAAFAKLWKLAAARMERGEQLDGFTVGSTECSVELAPLLKSRAMLLQEWVNDDSCWDR